MDYYEVLGVSRNASHNEIKKAYWKKSKEHHPDTGGDEEKFKEIAEVCSVLSNPQKRAWYDVHGNYDQKEIDKVTEAQNLVCIILLGLLGEDQNRDILKEAKKTMKKMISIHQGNIWDAQKVLKYYSKIKDRFKKKDKIEFFINTVENKIAAVNATIIELERKSEVFNLTKEMLQEFEDTKNYDTDPLNIPIFNGFAFEDQGTLRPGDVERRRAKRPTKENLRRRQRGKDKKD